MKKLLTNWEGANLKTSFLLFGLSTFAWNMDIPQGLTAQGWHLLIIFIATIIGIIIKPLPVSGVAIISLALTIFTGTAPIEGALAKFSDPIVWLVLLAFFVARGFILSGLGERIAYWFISKMGKNTLGLSYGIILTELLLAPFIPSNAARGGGIVYPVVNSIAMKLGHNTAVRHTIAGFLILIAFQANVLTSTMFLTGNAGNPLVLPMAAAAGIQIDWFSWFQAAIVPGIISLLILPILMHFFYPVKERKTPHAPAMAKEKLIEMGKLTSKEIIMGLTFLIMLTLWVMGKQLNINATTAAFLGISILLFTGVLKVDDILEEQTAWQTYIWFATILTLSKFLGDYGVVSWVSSKIYTSISHFDWMTAFSVIALLYFYSHYAFASIAAHFSTLYAVSLGLAISLGTPPALAAYTLLFSSVLSSCLTHFGTTPAPIFFGSGHVSLQDWWKAGGLIGLAHIAVWVLCGGLWWKYIGLW